MNAGGVELILAKDCAISIAELRRAHESWLPAFMAA